MSFNDPATGKHSDSNSSAASDQELVAIAQAGGHSAFAELILRHHNTLSRKVQQITKNAHDTEDVLQDCSIKAFIHIKAFDGRSAFSTWLVRIAINTALTALRKTRHVTVASLDDHGNSERQGLWQIAEPSNDPEQDVLPREMQFQLKQAVRRLYIALKTEGKMECRAQCLARRLWIGTVVLTAVGVPAGVLARPASINNYKGHPVGFLVPLAVIASLGVIRLCIAKHLRLAAFLASCGYLASMLVGAATGLFPVLLPAVGTQGQDLTISRAISDSNTLRVGLIWWSAGISLAAIYTAVVYWRFRGKVPKQDEGYGH